MKAVRNRQPKAIHNNVCWLVQDVLREKLCEESPLYPLFSRFAADSSDDELYFAVLVLAFARWTEQWKITSNKGSFELFKALSEPAREGIEGQLAEFRRTLKEPSRPVPLCRQ